MILCISRIVRKKPALTIALWIIVPLTLLILSMMISPKWINVASLPNSESEKAMDILNKELPDSLIEGSFYQGIIVFHAENGIYHHRNEIDKYIKKLDTDKSMNVDRIYSPLDRDHTSQVASDGKTAYAIVFFDEDMDLSGIGKNAIEASSQLNQNVEVEFSGLAFDQLSTSHHEMYGFLAALIILTLLFGSLIAAGVPVVTAGIGILCGVSAVKLLSVLIPMPEISYQVGAMLGVGVGIDYVLFILTRYKRSLAEGKDQDESIDEAMASSGKAVFTAGIIVIISILGIYVVNIDYLNGLATGISICVFFMVVMALTLIPAVLATRIGNKLDKFSLPIKKKRLEKQETVWEHWSRFVQKRAGICLIAGTLIMLILSLPVISLKIGTADSGNESTKKTTRRAYDLLEKSFGAGFNGPLVLVVDRKDATDADSLKKLMVEVQKDKEIDSIYPNPNGIVILDSTKRLIEGYVKAKADKSGANKTELRKQYETQEQNDLKFFVIYPKDAPRDEDTTALVKRLRNTIIKDNSHETGIKAYVTGITAAYIDFSDTLSAKIPLFFSAVLLISFFFLLFTFKSVLVPLKALLMNMLSIAAACGVVIALFQYGWLSDITGIGNPGPIDPWAPVMMFAILFGLSMDYEVFLLSNIKEEYLKSHNNSDSIAKGLAGSARVITAAALIMASVFISFAFSIDRPIKLMGIGLAAAVLLDATVIRMLLVPAAMELMGDRNWWYPKWLSRKQKVEPLHEKEVPSS